MDERTPGGETRPRPAKLRERQGLDGVAPEPPEPSPTVSGASHDGSEPRRAERDPHPPTVGARGLLDRLRSVELALDADRRLLSQLEEAGGKTALGPEGGRRPVRSPEAAEEERHLASSFAELADKLPEVRDRIAKGAKRRHEVLQEMAASGCFEGRWVGDGHRALYLERRANPDADAGEVYDGGSRYEVHQGPWAWVEDAPAGEDPRETLRRGEILARSSAGQREFFFLLGVPFLVASVGQTFVPPTFLGTLLAAIVVSLLFYLRRGRRRLLDMLFSGPHAQRRKAEEMAAYAQLELVHRGVADGPSLEELTREIERKLARKRSEGEVVLATTVEGPRTGGVAARLFGERVVPAEEPDDRAADAYVGEEALPGEDPREASGTTAREVAILLSLASGEKNLGELLAHLRAFSGADFAPGPRETAHSLAGLERAGLVSKTSCAPPFARYTITPRGARGLRAGTARGSSYDHPVTNHEAEEDAWGANGTEGRRPC